MCTGCPTGTASAATGATGCAPCGADTFADDIGQTTCDPCSTCVDGSFESAGCDADRRRRLHGLRPVVSHLQRSGPERVHELLPTRELVGGRCQSLCGTAPKPGCLVAAQAELQAIEKKPGKEQLTLQWKKIATATTRASFGDPVGG